MATKKAVKIPLPVDLGSIEWTMLRHDHKLEGYGMVWALLNRLASTSNYTLPMQLVPTIAADMQVPEQTLIDVIKKYGIFQYNENSFWYTAMVPIAKKQSAPEQQPNKPTSAGAYTPEQQQSFEKFNVFLKESCPRVSQLTHQMTIDEYLKVCMRFKRDAITRTLGQMENYKPLLTKYVSVYLTLTNWTKNNGEGQVISEADKKLLRGQYNNK